FQVDSYLQDLIEQPEKSRLNEFYVRPFTTENTDLENVVRRWMAQPNPPPLAILGGYGTGKSTFAQKFAASLASECIGDATKRVPILVPLGEIVDDQTI